MLANTALRLVSLMHCFKVDHIVKDPGIALQESEQMGLSLPGLELAGRLYQQLQAIGHGQSGTQALIHAIRRLSE